MRLGVLAGGNGLGLDELIGQVREAAGAGLDSAYFSQVLSWDAVTLAALAAREVPGIAVGTAVTQTYPRHPLALAGQALTAQAASGNRFTLGIGPSHGPLIETHFGLSYDRPARHVREYLSALVPLLRGEQVDYHGETLTAAGRVMVPGAEPPPVLLAALGPVMLRMAGELADGAVTVWTGPETIARHVTPAVTRAAAAAGRPRPRVVAGVIMSVTADPEGVRRRVAESLGPAGNLPSYRAMLDRQGKSGVEETIVAGDEPAVEQAVRAYAEAGVTELVVSLFGDPHERARTLGLLGALRGPRGDAQGDAQ
ncbi:TIGR03564 family F420-dependent LLM class oxidoreductase [Microbispora sp. SCL1-1]|jgi:F420-dependent oxidoreductase-like protein|uniref:TIGR03564 family F420-dependent LLM class oxidoreductase n=1 Tax=Microbispora hainanensis TaxID=568844 RepID=A0ABZ1SZN8_9ACTN|nr:MULTISPECIES: TIGR03564 family F420-dependent LLM class oxidoreductase [Microbispora]NJP28004.1 TIGR03564 family F420-dependent LLM class oxidoreductase [Microbispora sp. CL1-1]TQS10355.1 TIGR03564 family F420-dependent LLM class oxidoreductase [Microbispora sp. SCL1-1]